MPRMKNAASTSKSPHKSATTLHKFGFTSPTNAEKSKQHASESGTPKGKKDIEPIAVKHKPITLTIKKEKLKDQKPVAIPAKIVQTASSERKPLVTQFKNSETKTSKDTPSLSGPVRGPIKLTITQSPDKTSAKVTLDDATSQGSPQKQKHKTVFVPPVQSRSQRTITPSKRVLEDIADDDSQIKLSKKSKVDSKPNSTTRDNSSSSMEVIKRDSLPSFIECESSDATASPVNQTKRVRKPSHKILMMLETEKDLPLTGSSTPGTTTLLNDNSTGNAFSDPPGGPCFGCFIENAKMQKAFKRNYCFACLYIYKTWISKKEFPDCKPDCNRNNPHHCKGCRAFLMNASLPDGRKLEFSPGDEKFIRQQNTDQKRAERVKKLKLEPIADIKLSTPTSLTPVNQKNSPTPLISKQLPSNNIIINGTQLQQILPQASKNLILKPNTQILYKIPVSTTGGQAIKLTQLQPKVQTAVNIRPMQSSSERLTQLSQICKLVNKPHILSDADILLPSPVEQLQESEAAPASAGPRVKHVSRSRDAAQGEPAVIQPTNLRLSALPPDEKCKIWNETQKLTEELSDNDELIEQNKKTGGKVKYESWLKDPDSDRQEDEDDEEYRPSPPPQPKMKIKTKFMPKKMSSGGTGKRRPRCGHCSGCTASNCTKCVFCKDMKKYGGPGRLKQCCVERRCLNKDGPSYENKNIYDDYYNPLSVTKKKRFLLDDDDDRSVTPPIRAEKKKSRPPRRHLVDPQETGSSLGDVGDAESVPDSELAVSVDEGVIQTDMTNKPLTELLRVSQRNKSTHATNNTTVDAIENPLVTADGTIIKDQNPGFSLNEKLHRLMADFIDTYDIDKVWQQGVALVTSQPQSIRVLCYLCGSAGIHELIYCSVCCEPFHEFCLEEKERPIAAGGVSSEWLCRNCKFCQVCGKLGDLLTCDRCSKTYHADCLVEGYMVNTLPTSAGIWVCNGCLKCTSCGATTPGQSAEDKWSTDLSLCAKCDKLRQKGNYCPICGGCYSDDDWECKMIGCSKCDSWTHAKCELLPDDLYSLVGFVEDDEAQYVCKNCRTGTHGFRADWLTALEKLRKNGFSIVLTSIMDKKFAQPISEIDEQMLKQFYDQHQKELEGLVEKKSAVNTSAHSFSTSADTMNVSSDDKKSKPEGVVEGQPAETSSPVRPIQAPSEEEKGVTEEERPEEKPEQEQTADSESEAEEIPRRSLRSSTALTQSVETPKLDKKSAKKSSKHSKTKDNKEVKKEKITSPQDESTPVRVTRASRSSHAQEYDSSKTNSSSTDSVSKTNKNSTDLKKKNSKTHHKQSKTGSCETEESESKSLTKTSKTPLRRSGRQANTNTDEELESAKQHSKSTDLEEKKVKEEILSPRRSGRDRSKSQNKHEEASLTSKSQKQVAQDESTTPHAAGGSHSADSSVLDVSASEELSGHAYDLVDLSVRFCDVEWIKPVVTYDSLVEGNHPIDLRAVKDRLETYNSLNEFVDDVVRIIQTALTRSKVQDTKVYKNVLATKKLFHQEMSNLFPWFDINKSPLWDHNTCVPKGMLEEAQLPPSSEHTYALWLSKSPPPQEPLTQPSPYKLQPVTVTTTAVVPFSLTDTPGTTTQESSIVINAPGLDLRKCQFCASPADDEPNEAGRLIYAGADDWVHVNCALWSAEVYEEVDGTLQKVHTAIHRGKQLECCYCANKGATVGCCAKTCTANYHFKCAKSADCVFLDDKQVFCRNCLDSLPTNMVLNDKFSVLRTVTVDFAHVKIKKPWQKGFRPEEINIITGSMTVENLGYIIPECDYLNVLVPVNYSVSRIFWSTKSPYQRCVYTCTVTAIDPRLQSSSNQLPDMTICHDPTIPTYTPPELLCDKYPHVFPPKLYNGLLDTANSTDYTKIQVTRDSLSNSWPSTSAVGSMSKGSILPYPSLSSLSERTKQLLGLSMNQTIQAASANQDVEDDKLANLVGIAAALNRAAHRSQHKHKRRALKHAKLVYGSSQPEVTGNLDDNVAEILDMVEDDVLSEEELEERNVVIIRDVDESVAKEVVKVIESMSEEEAEVQGGVQAVMQSIIDKHKQSSSTKPDEAEAMETSGTTADEKQVLDGRKQVLDDSSTTDRLERVSALLESQDLSMDEADAEVSNLTATQPESSNSVTSSSQSSFKAYSSTSSLSPSDTEAELTKATSSPSALLTPPKIVITDFSIDEPADQMDTDPFQGVSPNTTSALSHGTRDRLKSLVRKRSESLGDIHPVGSSRPSLDATDRKWSSLDEESISQRIRGELPSLSEDTAEDQSRLVDKKHESMDTALTEISENIKKRPSLSISTIAFDKENLAQYDRPEMRRKRKRFRGISLKPKFCNDMCPAFNTEIESLVITRDRTPVASDESDSDSEQLELLDKGGVKSQGERLVVPPGVNCIIKDQSVWQHLPNILSAVVRVERLPADSDAESLSESEALLPEADTTIPHLPRELSPTLRDMSRDVRKDIINYCEDSGSSSSTDEEDLVRPRALRRRATNINYNENKRHSSEEEGDDSSISTAADNRSHRTPKQRAMSGKIVLNKDGTIRSRSENIPSELQKTISDAIKKAQSKDGAELPRFVSNNQAYAGAGVAGAYTMMESRRQNYENILSRNSAPLVDLSHLPRLKSLTDRRAFTSNVAGEECSLSVISRGGSFDTLPAPAMEEEITGDGNSFRRRDINLQTQRKPSSKFLAFTIESDDGFTCKADNWNDAWRSVTDAVRDMRTTSGCTSLSFSGVDGLRMFGLEHTSISYFTEQLYGARYCHQYRFKFHHPPLFEYDDELVETPSGCSRSEAYKSRKQPEMFSFLDSRYRKRPLPTAMLDGKEDNSLTQLSSRRATSMDLPMAMRFRHLKNNAREAAAVYRSGIHGRGLYCKRNIDAGEMVIEYAGEVIRHTLCDKREKLYESKGIGCYMFRIDDNLVVDATMKGNAARFINHSCDPNCFSKIIDVNGEKHIVIFASRSIQIGEELTYDYKFPKEDIKIVCTCGAKRCRGYLN